MTARLSDRIAGAIILALAVWYFIQAGTYEAGLSDPAGPTLFPQAVAVPTGFFALLLILRPDPNPVWFRWPHVVGQIAMLVVLIVYPLLIEPLGFPISTFLGTVLLARILGGTWLQSVVTGLAMGIGLFLMFDIVFGLPLPAGPIFG
ncbi:MAG TPA: tripartite tricarboxylate transporter TctB family protein [Paracoccaceae bacterium]|nr:tripartite tricarboxylate transporter TctB family protein [Paracoccaceae bacterium]